MLQDYYKRRNETQNFTIKDTIVTESFGPLEALKSKPLTPTSKTRKSLDCSSTPMTTLEFTKTNFKLSHLSDLKSRSSVNFFKPKVFFTLFAFSE